MRFLLSIAILVSLSGAATAQVSGNRLGGCPEAAYLNPNELAIAVGFSLTDNAARAQLPRMLAGQPAAAGIKMCADSIAYSVCTDKMLFNIIDPAGAAVGGAIGLAIDTRSGGPSLLGGLIGMGAGGLIKGTIDTAQCRKRQAAHHVAAYSVLANARLTLGGASHSVNLDAIRASAANLGRAGQITAGQADYINTYVTGVAQRLGR